MGHPVKGMNCKLKNVLEEEMTFEYEYDFGSTTALTISVFDYRVGNREKEKLTILSRNNPIEYTCGGCGKKPATAVCAECGELLCEDCREDHECGKDMLMRICNSPRFGVCGYEGSTKYPDKFIPCVPNTVLDMKK